MTTSLEVMSIEKSNRDEPEFMIQAIGGQNPDGTFWKISQGRAVYFIENGSYDFFIRDSGQKVKVVVDSGQFGQKYLRTELDEIFPEHLLRLPAYG